MKKLIALTLSLIILVSLIPATFAGAGPGFQIKKYTLRVGESTLLDYSPESGNVTSMQWISSNPSVGTIDKNGKFTALNAGTTEITVKYTKVYPEVPECGIIADVQNRG